MIHILIILGLLKCIAIKMFNKICIIFIIKFSNLHILINMSLVYNLKKILLIKVHINNTSLVCIYKYFLSLIDKVILLRDIISIIFFIFRRIAAL